MPGGGEAVNAYVEPVVSLDLDVAVATEQLELVERLLRQDSWLTCSTVSTCPLPARPCASQIQTDPRYGPFVARATPASCWEFGFRSPDSRTSSMVRCEDDGTGRRPSTRQKDLADIARLLEAYPALRERVPAEILARLV